jgi:hypothetical protein
MPLVAILFPAVLAVVRLVLLVPAEAAGFCCELVGQGRTVDVLPLAVASAVEVLGFVAGAGHLVGCDGRRRWRGRGSRGCIMRAPALRMLGASNTCSDSLCPVRRRHAPQRVAATFVLQWRSSLLSDNNGVYHKDARCFWLPYFRSPPWRRTRLHARKRHESA